MTEEEELLATAARMRAHAIEHPLPVLATLSNPKLLDQYSHDTIYAGLCLRMMFTVTRLNGRDALQLTISERPDRRAIPPEVADRIRDAFFEPTEIVGTMGVDERNFAALMIGRSPIADINTEHFISFKKRKP